MPGINERLTGALKAGRYDVDGPVDLAERVTDDLRAASGDGHLYLRYDPAQFAAARQAGGTGAGTGSDELNAYQRKLAVREHHGLTDLHILPGNIRYLRISQFYWVKDETGAAYDAAMRFLRDGDAAIIDLRGNPGGEHPGVRYLISHFLGADTLELTFLEGTHPPVQSRTLDHLPAGRLNGKPLYVLIDGRTGSAAEAFAYDVQQFKVGDLVGATTAGAANNNKLVPIAPYFMLSVSYGRPVHSVSNANWEGVGVAPTVAAAPAQALEVAESLALARLASTPNAAPEALAEYTWARVAIDARLYPVVVPPARLRALAGRYGEISIALRDGSLWMARGGRPARRLIPLTTGDLFAVEDADRLRVQFRAKTLELLWMGIPAPRVFTRE